MYNKNDHKSKKKAFHFLFKNAFGNIKRSELNSLFQASAIRPVFRESLLDESTNLDKSDMKIPTGL